METWIIGRGKKVRWCWVTKEKNRFCGLESLTCMSDRLVAASLKQKTKGNNFNYPCLIRYTGGISLHCQHSRCKLNAQKEWWEGDGMKVSGQRSLNTLRQVVLARTKPFYLWNFYAYDECTFHNNMKARHDLTDYYQIHSAVSGDLIVGHTFIPFPSTLAGRGHIVIPLRLRFCGSAWMDGKCSRWTGPQTCIHNLTHPLTSTDPDIPSLHPLENLTAICLAIWRKPTCRSGRTILQGEAERRGCSGSVRWFCSHFLATLHCCPLVVLRIFQHVVFRDNDLIPPLTSKMRPLRGLCTQH